MRYFNPNYWLELWMLIIPIFYNEKAKVHAMPRRSVDIEPLAQQSLASLQNLSIAFNQSEFLTHKHRHQKHQKRHFTTDLQFNSSCQ